MKTIDDLVKSPVTRDCDDPSISRQLDYSRYAPEVRGLQPPGYVQVPGHLHGLACPLRDNDFKLSLQSRQHRAHSQPDVLNGLEIIFGSGGGCQDRKVATFLPQEMLRIKLYFP